MKRSFRIILLLLSIVCIASLASCASLDADGSSEDPQATPMPELTAPLFEDYDSVYIYYNQVSFSDTIVTLTERFGSPEKVTEEGAVSYHWKMEDGLGFACAFFDNGTLRAKVVYYDDIRQFREICKAQNLSIVENFDDSFSFQDCVSYFVGRPIEVAQLIKEEGSSDISRVYTWVDENDNIVQILFKPTGGVETVSYNVK